MRAPERSKSKLVEVALEYYEEAIDGIFDGKRFESFDLQKASNAVRWCYEKCGYKAPHIIVVENPLEQMLLFEHLALDFLDNSIDDMFSSEIERQICSEIDGITRYYSFEDEDFCSRIDIEIKDKLYHMINNCLYEVIFEATLRNKIEEPFGKSDLGKVSLEILKFLDLQPGNHFLTYRNNHSWLETGARLRPPLLEILSVFSISYLAFIKFLVEELRLPVPGKEDFRSFYDLHRESGIFSCCCSEQIVIICKYPKKIFQDKDRNWELHNSLGSAIEWNHIFAKFDCHYIEGTYLATALFEKVNSRELSYEMFAQVRSDWEKVGVITLMKKNFGEDELFRFFDARLIDETKVVHRDDYVETVRIYQTQECYSFLSNRWGEMNQPFAWIEFTCPSTQQKHLIPTCPKFKKAIDAAKWHRPDFLPEDIPYRWAKAC